MSDLLSEYKRFVYHRQETLIHKTRSPEYVSPILGTNKFTNIQRIFDRVSQYEVKEVVLSSDNPINVIENIFIFNQIKTPAFWNAYKDYKVEIWQDDFDPVVFSEYFAKKSPNTRMFTNAYVVPGKPGESKIQTIATRAKKLLSLRSQIGDAIARQSIKEIFNTLKSIEGIGDFLASQVCFDFLWHPVAAKWKPLYTLGVGAIRGAYKLGLIHSLHPKEDDCEYALKTALFEILPDYPYLYANDNPICLTIPDIQNTFCESDKWLRLVRPDIKSGSNSPTKIKNKYVPKAQIDYVVPGHWVASKDQLVKVRS